MSKRLCTAGVRGPYSYVILNNDANGVVARVLEDESEIDTAKHLDMDLAEQWVNKCLQSLMKRNYETD